MDDVELAIEVARAGALVVRSRFGTSVARTAKEGVDFTTDVDIAAEQAVRAVLRQARPEDAIRGEELGTSGARQAVRTWLVDPLCGTLNFAARTPAFSVNVALVVGAQVTAAAIADPLAGEVYWTDGTRASIRRSDGDHPATPTSESRLIDVNADSADPDEHGFSPSRFLSSGAFRSLRPRVLSTTLALAWVATGQRAGYVTAGDLAGSVHFTGGIALCQASGCVVTNLYGGPLHAGAGGLIAAADAETHAILLAAVGS